MKTKGLKKALTDFRKQYPMTIIADLQTFMLGWNAGNENKESYAKEHAIEFATEMISPFTTDDKHIIKKTMRIKYNKWITTKQP